MEFEEAQTSEGLYMTAFFDEETNKRLADYIKTNGIPNPVASSSFHTTIVYSRVPVPGFEPHHTLEVPVNTRFSKIECWDTNSGRTLVLKFFSPYLHFRFQEAIAAGATYDYDEYKPHITLSYDIGDDFAWEDLPAIEFPLTIIGEYSEPLFDV